MSYKLKIEEFAQKIINEAKEDGSYLVTYLDGQILNTGIILDEKFSTTYSLFKEFYREPTAEEFYHLLIEHNEYHEEQYNCSFEEIMNIIIFHIAYDILDSLTFDDKLSIRAKKFKKEG